MALDQHSVPRTNDHVAVKVENLSVCLPLQKERITSLREYVVRLFNGRRIEKEDFWPLRDVTFRVTKGETFGIIGPNGAGKSTLLKVIAGIVPPTRGRVEVRGLIAPLIELGAGLDPELTGRENIYLFGSLLGLSRKQLAGRFDRIVEFAGLADFLDVPLKNYSSGMASRLGFAIATDVDPDVLIVDEVFAVGDEAFQQKCAEKMAAFRGRGTTVLLVTHDMHLMAAMCTRALLLDHGCVISIGLAQEVAEAYGRMLAR